MIGSYAVGQVGQMAVDAFGFFFVTRAGMSVFISPEPLHKCLGGALRFPAATAQTLSVCLGELKSFSTRGGHVFLTTTILRVRFV